MFTKLSCTCGHRMDVSKSLPGAEVQCEACGKELRVPMPPPGFGGVRQAVAAPANVLDEDGYAGESGVVTDMDVTSGDMLAELAHNLSESGIELRVAELKDPVKDKLRRFELFERFGAANFYPTIGSAVEAYLEEHAIDWKP